MNTQRKLDLAWLMLVVLTVGGAGIGSTDRSGLAVAVIVALVLFGARRKAARRRAETVPTATTATR